MDARTFKDDAYGELAAVIKAMASARRLELIDLLVQGPRSVFRLSRDAGQSVASTSQHLQVLKRARLVEGTRHGTTIEYQLAGGVADVLVILRRFSTDRSAELQALQQRFFAAVGAPETIEREDLQLLRANDEVVLIDVRPRWEFDLAHIEGALSYPFDELPARTSELPRDRLIVATCRGPYCVFAADAVRTLRDRGFRAVRFEDGVAEWRVDGGSVVP